MAKLQEITVAAIKDQPKRSIRTPQLLSTPRLSGYSSTRNNPKYKPPNHSGLLPTPNMPMLSQASLSRAATNKIFDETWAKGIYFWCDEKFHTRP